jgi:hypothetical protein
MSQLDLLSDCFPSASHHDVANISKIIPLHLIFKDGLHDSTERRADILEAFGHPKITIGAEGCNKDCFLFILFVELYLMVPRETI